MKFVIAAALSALSLCSMAGEPDPTVMSVKRDVDLVWTKVPNAPGLESTVMYGNPAGPGPYIVRVRFAPGAMSPPHFHPEERHVVVLKGTWWVGSGPRWDRDATTPLPAGSFAVHYAGKIHYDGAKDEEVIVQISGVGPSGTKGVDEAGNVK
jgi:quercetin dioxygenase-like cupin family protein